MRKKGLLAGLVLSISLMVCPRSWATMYLLDATPTKVQEVPPTFSTGHSTDSFSANSATDVVTVLTGHYEDFETNVNGVTLDDGPAGTNGTLIGHFTFSPMFVTQGNFSGSITLSGSQFADLLLGDVYVNIDTVEFPDGAIRAQLSEVPEPGTWALFGVALPLAWAAYRFKLFIAPA